MSEDLSFPKGGLFEGKKGLIMGVANDKSIAWGIAAAVASQGGEIAFSYQGDALLKRVKPLAESIGSDTFIECDVTNSESITSLFEKLKEKWGKIDLELVTSHSMNVSEPMDSASGLTLFSKASP